jgi:hypothetical protein
MLRKLSELFRGGNRGEHVVLVGDVRGHINDLFAELVGELLALVVGDVSDHHGGSCVRQAPYGRTAQTAGAAGDNRAVSLEPHGSSTFWK